MVRGPDAHRRQPPDGSEITARRARSMPRGLQVQRLPASPEAIVAVRGCRMPSADLVPGPPPACGARGPRWPPPACRRFRRGLPGYAPGAAPLSVAAVSPPARFPTPAVPAAPDGRRPPAAGSAAGSPAAPRGLHPCPLRRSARRRGSRRLRCLRLPMAAARLPPVPPRAPRLPPGGYTPVRCGGQPAGAPAVPGGGTVFHHGGCGLGRLSRTDRATWRRRAANPPVPAL